MIFRLKEYTLTLVLIVFSLGAFAQKREAILLFNDGSSVEGYGMAYYNHKIKFRASLDSKPDTWTDLMVKGIIIYDKLGTPITYKYVTLEEGKKAKLLEVLTEGFVTLYIDGKARYKDTYFGSYSTGLTYLTGLAMHTTKLYVKKDTENTCIPLFPNFKQKVKEYFTDCIGLVEKLDSGEFQKKNSIDMVDYYNDFCGE